MSSTMVTDMLRTRNNV